MSDTPEQFELAGYPVVVDTEMKTDLRGIIAAPLREVGEMTMEAAFDPVNSALVGTQPFEITGGGMTFRYRHNCPLCKGLRDVHLKYVGMRGDEGTKEEGPTTTISYEYICAGGCGHKPLNGDIWAYMLPQKNTEMPEMIVTIIPEEKKE